MLPTEPRPSPSLRDAYCLRWLLLTGAFSMVYAVVRYNVFKGVEWEHLPLYIVNKATSLSAVILLASSYLIGKWIRVHEDEPEKRLVLVKFLGLSGFALAVVHGIMSILMHSRHYYPKFFGEAKMNLTGELMALFGVLALLWMASPALSSLPYMQEALGGRLWKRSQRFGYLALIFAALHLVVMGSAGWFDPSTWPGSMPPITMLGFIVVVVPLLAKLFSGRAEGA